MKAATITHGFAAVVVAMAVSVVNAQESSTEAREARLAREAARARLELARSSTLPEAARASGGTYRVEQDWNSWQIASGLQSLFESSDVVIVGKLEGSQSNLSPDQRAVSTMLSLRASEVLKGDVRLNQALLVWTPGGSVTLADGTVVEVRIKDWEPLTTGQRCVLFLSAMEPSAQAAVVGSVPGMVLAPTLGRQGVFVIAGDRVSVRGRSVDIVQQQYSQSDVGKFMRELRALKKG
jgi:hypothetical protein